MRTRNKDLASVQLEIIARAQLPFLPLDSWIRLSLLWEKQHYVLATD